MIDNIKVTVIVPTHNSEVYIEECVRSVMSQTYKNIEIICVDSSCDNTIGVLKQLQTEDARIQIIEDSNGSYGHKLNVGIQHATGDYVAIVESDDYILPDMYRFMLEGLSEEVDYIKTAANNFVDVNGERFFFPERIGENEHNLNSVINLEKERSLAFLYLPRIWAAIYRRRFLLENGIVANETPGASFQDTSFTYAVALLAKKCIYKTGAFYCYRNDNPNSSVKSKSKIFCVCDEYKHLDKILSAQNKNTEDMSQIILHQKLITYTWNIKRLEVDAAKEFRDGIKDELKEYTEDIVSTLSKREQDLLRLLLDEKVLEEYNKKQQEAIVVWEEIIQILREKKCVLIGAGAIGKMVLELNDWLKQNAICAVGDNNYAQIQMKEQEVISVKETVNRWPRACYIVANKNHYSELEEQLIELGIKKEQIVYVNESINKVLLFSKCIKTNL